jgi:hypothetical protein
MSPEVTPILIGVLTVFVGTTIVFGHRYNDKKEKFDEKSKIDELNEIRMSIRSDTTSSALENIWHFIDEQISGKKIVKRVWELFYETTSRQYFNRLINELEKTFKESMDVRDVWDDLRRKYGQLGRTLYLFGIIEAVLGYPLIAFFALDLFLSAEQYYIWSSSLFVVAFVFISIIIHTQRKISHNSEIYEKIKSKYMIDEVRIGN